jgi:hypothetical protein
MALNAKEPIRIGIQRWKIELVRVADLRIDPTYHDPARFSERRAKLMAANLNREALGIITVSHRGDGSLIIVDGQHRVAACRIAGEEYILAKVFYGLTVEEEARLFKDLGDIVRLTSYAIYLSALQAHDPEAVAIFAICKHHGVTIVGGAAAYTFPGRTRSVSMIARIHSAGLLDKTLHVCRQAWPEDIHALDSIPLGGVASFIWGYERHPRFSTKRLTTKLAEESPQALIRKAKDFSRLGDAQNLKGSTGGKLTPRATTGAHGIGSLKAARRAVLLRYNSHLSEKLRLDDLTSSQIHRLAVQRQDIWEGLMEDK